jgi:hypothetical protein
VIKAVVFIPARSNAGRPFPRTVWDALIERLERFGGYTRGPRQIGAWHDGARWYREANFPFTVVLSVRDLAAWLDLLAWVQEVFEQEALYVEVAGQPEIVDFRAGGQGGRPSV